jgi:hypothetical protein
MHPLVLSGWCAINWGLGGVRGGFPVGVALSLCRAVCFWDNVCVCDGYGVKGRRSRARSPLGAALYSFPSRSAMRALRPCGLHLPAALSTTRYPCHPPPPPACNLTPPSHLCVAMLGATCDQISSITNLTASLNETLAPIVSQVDDAIIDIDAAMVTLAGVDIPARILKADDAVVGATRTCHMPVVVPSCASPPPPHTSFLRTVLPCHVMPPRTTPWSGVPTRARAPSLPVGGVSLRCPAPSPSALTRRADWRLPSGIGVCRWYPLVPGH